MHCSDLAQAALWEQRPAGAGAEVVAVRLSAAQEAAVAQPWEAQAGAAERPLAAQVVVEERRVELPAVALRAEPAVAEAVRRAVERAAAVALREVVALAAQARPSEVALHASEHLEDFARRLALARRRSVRKERAREAPRSARWKLSSWRGEAIEGFSWRPLRKKKFETAFVFNRCSASIS